MKLHIIHCTLSPSLNVKFTWWMPSPQSSADQCSGCGWRNRFTGMDSAMTSLAKTGRLWHQLVDVWKSPHRDDGSVSLSSASQPQPSTGASSSQRASAFS